MDTAKVRYVFRYYSHLMTECERMAYRHLVGTAKASRGRTDVDAQAEARDGLEQDSSAGEGSILPHLRSSLHLCHAAECWRRSG